MFGESKSVLEENSGLEALGLGQTDMIRRAIVTKRITNYMDPSNEDQKYSISCEGYTMSGGLEKLFRLQLTYPSIIEENTTMTQCEDTLNMKFIKYAVQNFDYSDILPASMQLKNIRGWSELIQHLLLPFVGVSRINQGGCKVF